MAAASRCYPDATLEKEASFVLESAPKKSCLIPRPTAIKTFQRPAELKVSTEDAAKAFGGVRFVYKIIFNRLRMPLPLQK